MSLQAQESISTTTWKITDKNTAQAIALFNKARAKENLKNITIDETYWNMNDEEKIFYIINQERIDRGINPFRGISEHLSTITTEYSTNLLNSIAIGHRAFRGNSWNRIASSEKIATCFERIDYAENISWFRSNKGYEPFYILRSVFSWMYDDAQHDWRHRKLLLYNDFSFNEKQTEGLIGVGISHGKFKNFNYNTIVTINLFDPCPTWKHIEGNYYE